MRWVCSRERRQQLADEPMGRLEVVGEWDVGVDGRHTINTHDDRRCDTVCSIDYVKSMRPVQTGCGCGQREPRPPPGAAQVDALQDGGDLGGGDLDAAALASGKRKAPFSSRLYQSAKPSRSQ